MIEVEFLATTLYFYTPLNEVIDNTLALMISLFSLVLGLITIFFSTFKYFQNQKNINSQSFRSSSKIIVFNDLRHFAVNCGLLRLRHDLRFDNIPPWVYIKHCIPFSRRILYFVCLLKGSKERRNKSKHIESFSK